MLSVSAYPQSYIDQARARIASQVAVFSGLTSAVRAEPRTARAGVGSALDELEPEYFANLVIALDSHFVHRSRGQERKDGNAMNEVRVLVSSIQYHDSILTPEKGIRLDPARSVAGHRVRRSDPHRRRGLRATGGGVLRGPRGDVLRAEPELSGRAYGQA